MEVTVSVHVSSLLLVLFHVGVDFCFREVKHPVVDYFMKAVMPKLSLIIILQIFSGSDGYTYCWGEYKEHRI